MTEFAQLLFTWAIAHADDWGCIDGDPDVVMATVIPMKRDRTSQDVDAAIREWVENGLVWWYEVAGKPIIQFCTWDDHQTGLNKRTKPKYTLYKHARTSENFREILRNSSLTEENRTELKGTEENAESEVATSLNSTDSSSSLDLQFGQVIKLFESEGFGTLSSTVQEHLEMYYDEFGGTWLMEAMKEAVYQNKRRLSYVRSILNNWRSDGGIKRSGAAIQTKARDESKADIDNDFLEQFRWSKGVT